MPFLPPNQQCQSTEGILTEKVQVNIYKSLKCTSENDNLVGYSASVDIRISANTQRQGRTAKPRSHHMNWTEREFVNWSSRTELEYEHWTVSLIKIHEFRTKRPSSLQCLCQSIRRSRHVTIDFAHDLQGGNYQIWSGGSESPQPMTRHNSIAFQNRISDCRAHETASFSHHYEYFLSFGIN